MATLCNPARPGRRKPGPPRRAHQAVPDVHPLPAALARRAVRHAWHADGHHPRDLPPRPARSPAPQGNPLRPRPGMSLHSALHSTLRERPGSHRCAPAGAWARDLSESDACLACATASLVRDQKELPRADAPASAKRSERAHRSASPRCWPLDTQSGALMCSRRALTTCLQPGILRRRPQSRSRTSAQPVHVSGAALGRACKAGAET
jgi:hypothetical protein